MPSAPGRPELTGIFTCLGFCWVFVQPVVRSRIFRQLRLCLVPSWSSQVSFCPHPSRRRRISSKICQGLLAGRSPRSTSHHTTPSPISLPEDLLLSRFVLVRRDAVQPPLSPLYDGPFLVLERSLHFFKVRVGSRIETISTHRLKPCHTPQDVQTAEPPRRGRPPNAAKPVSHPSTKVSISASKGHRRVTFADPVATFLPRPPPAPPDRAARLRRSTARPARYTA